MEKTFSTKESRNIAKKLGTKLNKHGLAQFKQGLTVELEHGTDATKEGVNANETNDNPINTGKIALAHINEHPNYYTGLAKMEKDEEKKEKKSSLKSIITKNIKK
jgi:hypothetical protein